MTDDMYKMSAEEAVRKIKLGLENEVFIPLNQFINLLGLSEKDALKYLREGKLTAHATKTEFGYKNITVSADEAIRFMAEEGLQFRETTH